jgi:transposase-like protein
VTQPSIPLPIALRKSLEQASPDLLRELLRMFLEKLMSNEADSLCGADYGERAEERVNSRNGYRIRPLETRVGEMALRIPRLRTGSYFPEWLLQPRRRSERALLSVVAEAYVLGVSTRRVERLMETIGLSGISKSRVSEIVGDLDEAVEAFRQRPLEVAYPYLWLDALEVKSREGGRTVNVTVVVATGVNEAGNREVLGVDVFASEDGAAWLGFLRSLVARGLRGVKLAISDAHPGLKAAIAAVLPGSAWQRCRAHFVQNLLAQVPKSAHLAVSSLFRSIYAQLDPENGLLRPTRAQCDIQQSRRIGGGAES